VVLKAQGDYAGALTAYDETLRLFPRDVCALNGRAEALKAQGEYAGALTAYDEILRWFPRNIMAAESRTMLLILMRNIEAARERILTSPSNAKEEWLGYHTRGMFQLRINEFTGAIDTFQDGFQRCPFQDYRPYFATALGAAYIRVRRADDSLAILQSLNGHLDATSKLVRDLILVHFLGETGDRPSAAQVLAQTFSSRASLVMNLRKSLALKYGLGNGEDRQLLISNESLGGEIEEAEFRLLAEGPPLRQRTTSTLADTSLRTSRRLSYIGGVEEESSRSIRALITSVASGL
jgi:Tetratricopeptide repeat